MLEGLSKIQKAVVVAMLILLAALTVWSGWTAISMSTGRYHWAERRSDESVPIDCKCDAASFRQVPKLAAVPKFLSDRR
jgi:hypothetical protein